jgi:hypothetical protein
MYTARKTRLHESFFLGQRIVCTSQLRCTNAQMDFWPFISDRTVAAKFTRKPSRTSLSLPCLFSKKPPRELLEGRTAETTADRLFRILVDLIIVFTCHRRSSRTLPSTVRHRHYRLKDSPWFMEESPPPCPSGGLIALLSAMDSRRLAGPNIAATTTQFTGTIQVSNHVGSVQNLDPVETYALEADHPVQPAPQDDSPALDSVEATHHGDPRDGFHTPKKIPMSCTSVSKLPDTLFFLFFLMLQDTYYDIISQ